MASAGFGRRVEGLHAVVAAAERDRIRRLHIEKGRLKRPEYQGLAAAVDRSGGAVVEVDDVRPLAESEAPQGVVADAQPIPFLTLDEMASPGAALIALDHLEDPQNVGAIARSALAAGMTGMVWPSRRSAPLGAATLKAAAGAMERLPVAEVNSIPDALRRLSDHGVWSVGLDGGSGQSLWNLGLLTESVVIVVGAEGGGLSRLVAEKVDVRASIPISYQVESLNASVAAALACFEVARVRSGG